MRDIEISQEDSFRLNILLASVEAICIDESAMVVRGLATQGEAQVQLHPTCRDEPYLRQVRAMIRRKVYGDEIGAAGALQTVLRLGYLDKGLLPNLLKLGEPEAVLKVAAYPEMTVELAEKVWWVMPDAEVARSLMMQAVVASSTFGRELALYLVDYLPFENDSILMLETMRLLLHSGQLDEATLMRLWLQGAHNPAIRVPFLEICPECIPADAVIHPLYATMKSSLVALSRQGNGLATGLTLVLSPQGLTIASAYEKIFQEPASQALFACACGAIGRYYATLSGNEIGCVRGEDGNDKQMAKMAQEVTTACPDLAQIIEAVGILVGTTPQLLDPVLSRTTATGAFLRDKLQPVLAPVVGALKTLQRGP